ncbi:hypothetical protein SARC_03510 [Sphaeroforma arctica JP610]|uniref:Uncharacterized protein n=1 Tax=Sphaeroforma arctica JP610 TaxID=667725 RepID=A0A0L0G5E7_9EUKA|nr:hypothetical protein SARC_03510 [Sphaeroforma arctica JP610]KNC84262.1 hypothetical protein SARC_03510 [Sphaeroforma arctica JP610]|eukprot:XP_014158164.1 hypothetical protein SARC_03510 [Sphaeroforma arctica JP610]
MDFLASYERECNSAKSQDDDAEEHELYGSEVGEEDGSIVKSPPIALPSPNDQILSRLPTSIELQKPSTVPKDKKPYIALKTRSPL